MRVLYGGGVWGCMEVVYGANGEAVKKKNATANNSPIESHA